MNDIMVALVSGCTGAGLFSFLQFMICRRDKRKAAESVERKAMRYLMLYIIQERGKQIIARGEATMDEKRSLRHWHDLYHNGLGGNGDADDLMDAISELPLDLA